ncbi:threonine/serine exporter family protein [Lachnospiraceae bacterium ASD3451]|uniref:threonine/serine exporter family protein n=2 Tax=Diplocloster agilis TaxID=2850323 RepID=UPI001D39E37F|nr:threonine/serine exporter family protein [Diplocloster agilis]MBU9742299.1 threonine/serine exporter family protein [Diplocloster agilis]
MILQIIGAFVSVLCFSIILEVPRKYLLYTSATGSLGWLIYLVVLRVENSTIMGSLISAIVVALLSNILARSRKAPVTTFFVPGILPIVPGVGMFRVVYYMLEKDFEAVKSYLFETFMIAGAIALAIFLIDSIFLLFLRYDRRRAKVGKGKKISQK